MVKIGDENGIDIEKKYTKINIKKKKKS